MKLKFASAIILFIVYRLTEQIINAQNTILYEGDICSYNSTTQGVCKYIYQCPIVQNLLAVKRIMPLTCGYDGFRPIVCCPRPKTKLLNSKLTTETGRLANEACIETYSSPGKPSHGAAGGVNAKLRELPSMVALGWPLVDGTGYAWNCGGTLISQYYVLTAAHCTVTLKSRYKTENPTIVRLGTLNLKEPSDSSRDVGIAEIYLHPQYKAPLKYNDIALLRLVKEVIITDEIKVACLLVENDFSMFPGVKLSDVSFDAFGWGKTEYSESSDVLQKVTLSLVDNITCNAGYKNRRSLSKGIIDSQICAGGKGVQDTCPGDSGGPLVFNVFSIKHIAGVTSFGIGCLGVQTPGVYTKVSSYIDWIESIVWK